MNIISLNIKIIFENVLLEFVYENVYENLQFKKFTGKSMTNKNS